MSISKSKLQKMQNVKFRNVDDFFEFLPADELKVVLALRQIIYDTIPDITEKLSYNVPYFKRKKNICFLWPASVLWGKTKTYDGVRFGFVNGHLLTDEMNYLEKGERKYVHWKEFTDVRQIDAELLKMFLYEAVEIDQALKEKTTF